MESKQMIIKSVNNIKSQDNNLVQTDIKSNDKSDDKSKVSVDIKKNKQKSNRCAFCNKKLKMIHFTCRCDLKFCEKHHNPHSHNCQFDMKKFHKDKLLKNNPTIHNKFEKI